MAHDEASLVHELREEFVARYPNGFCVKLHGGPFQPGLPDLLLSLERSAAFVEAKWATDAELEQELIHVVEKKLTDRQAINLSTIGKIDGPLRARVLIGAAVEAEELPGGKGTLVVAFDVANLGAFRRVAPHVTMMEVAVHQLALRTRTPSTLTASSLLQAQLKGRGETWLAGRLLLGDQYFGPIRASTDDAKMSEIGE